jgi:hypothetical protein
MKEIIEIRINFEYAHLLFGPDEGKNVGTSVKIVELTRDDPRFTKIPEIAGKVKERYNRGFFFGWAIKRKYGPNEWAEATLLKMAIKTTFEPAGEECGTLYDETMACPICGANGKQIGPLMLKRGAIPKKDIARTIAGEVVVSERFASAFKEKGLRGLSFNRVLLGGKESEFFQPFPLSEIELSDCTIAGANPFDLSTECEGEVYKCPLGHTIGLNLLSEVFVKGEPLIGQSDFFASRQNIGVKRGLLRPGPVYLCSPAFKKVIDEEKLKGFDFEIAYVG